jgi:hypothetical protein
LSGCQLLREGFENYANIMYIPENVQPNCLLNGIALYDISRISIKISKVDFRQISSVAKVSTDNSLFKSLYTLQP